MLTARLHRPAGLSLAGALFLSLATIAAGPGSASAGARGTGQVRPQASVTQNGITVSPTVEIVDGIIRGKLNATSASGQELAYSFVRSSNGGKMDIGNVPVSAGATTTDPQSFTVLPYATWFDASSKKTAWENYAKSWLDESVAKGTQTFTVRVSPVPGAGLTAKAALKLSATVDIAVDLDALAPKSTPLAFTYAVESFDDVKISANFFPASGLASRSTANTVLNSPGLGTEGVTDPYAVHGQVAHLPGPGYLRQSSGAGDLAFNVVTWDSRGTFASGGTMQFGSPFFEGRDVTALIDWLSTSTPATLDGSNDPAIGIFGESMGGATAFVVAATDPRVDAVVPTSAWTSLDTALSPNGVFRPASASAVLATLKAAGARVNATIRNGLTAGIKSGVLSETTRTALAATGPSILFHQMQAPALLIQSTTDALNRLDDSVWNAEEILDNPYGVPVKMVWFDAKNAGAAVTTIFDYSKKWFDKYVAGLPIVDAYTPNFQWWDQHGTRFTSNLYPFSQGFNSLTPVTASSAGGSLKFSPVKKGVVKVASFSVPVTVPSGNKIVGAPSVSFDYTGKGTAKAVLVRLVNKTTGAIVGATTTPVPVTLDGAAHTASVPLADIAHSVTSAADGTLTLEVLSWVKPFSKHWSGQVTISNLSVAVPLVALG